MHRRQSISQSISQPHSEVPTKLLSCESDKNLDGVV